jgi:glutamate/tyrosine decarboxylase-like PLP-dependent enzyme
VDSPDRTVNRALEFTPEEMRAFGYLVIDAIVEHFAQLRSKNPSRKGDRAALESLLRQPPPERGTDPADVICELKEKVFRNMMHVDHPRFFAFVPSPGNFAGAMADALASGFNGFVGTWFAGSGMAEIELVTIDWLRRMCGLPATAGGLFVSGGSMANLTALAVARRAALNDDMSGAVVYYSDQTHSSVDRGLRVLGFQPAQIRKVPSDAEFRLEMAALREAVEQDRAAGRRPFCVIANAGTTNTGAVDPFPDLAGFCRERGLWLHADGAYGAAAAISDSGRRLLGGLELVDSLSLDPHKWLFQPFEIGCVLVRDFHRLRETFRITPEYLQDVHRAGEEVNFCDHGIQLSRGFRALKLWMSLKIFGLEAFREAVNWGLHLAGHAERVLRASPMFEIVTPARLGIVTFRYAPDGRSHEYVDALNQALVDEMLADGYAVLTSTRLRGRTALRLCTINPRTTDEDIEETVLRLGRLGSRLAGGPG